MFEQDVVGRGIETGVELTHGPDVARAQLQQVFLEGQEFAVDLHPVDGVFHEVRRWILTVKPEVRIDRATRSLIRSESNICHGGIPSAAGGVRSSPVWQDSRPKAISMRVFQECASTWAPLIL